MPQLPWYQRTPDPNGPMYGRRSNATNRTEGLSDMSGDRYGQARGLQQDMYGQYGAMAAGQGPSLGQAQLQQGMDQTIAAQNAMAAQGRTGNLAAMQQQAGQAGVGAQLQVNQQAAQLAAQEQLAAMNAQAGLAGQMAGQDLQSQLAMEGLLGQQYGQQLAADTQWGLGQRELDLKQREGNRGFGMGLANMGLGAIFGVGG